MKLTVQYFGIAAALCFAYGVHAGPAMQPQNKQNLKGNLNAHTSEVLLTPPNTADELPPIALHVRPDGIIVPGVASPENNETTKTGLPFNSHPDDLETFPTVTPRSLLKKPSRREILVQHGADSSENLDATHSTDIVKPGKKHRSNKPKTFDKRPEKYFSQDQDDFAAMTSQERELNLTILWNLASQFQELDAGGLYGHDSWYGPEKSMVLQKFSVGVLDATVHDDNHDDVEFLSRLFNTTSQTLVTWYSNHLQLIRNGGYEDLKDPQFQSYEPIDDYNWVRKAHKVLATMTVDEQKEINNRIDNIDKLSVADLYKLYDTFEVRASMLLENQKQTAEFFQVAELKFPETDGTNNLLSIRGPIHIKDWNDESHPRHHSTRPVDALARYWIKAMDSNHDDLVTLTAIRLAHQPLTVQRDFVQRARNLSSPDSQPNPKQLKEFYDMLGIDWQGKDDDVKKIEAAKMLCVRELVFSDQPRRGKWSRVRQQPAMVNSCLPEEKEKRLQELFFIEKYDSEHKDPMQKRDEHSDPVQKQGHKIKEKITEVQEKIGVVKNEEQPKSKFEQSMLKLEDKIDVQLGKTREKLKEFGEAVKDVGSMFVDDATKAFDMLSGKDSGPIAA